MCKIDNHSVIITIAKCWVHCHGFIHYIGIAWFVATIILIYKDMYLDSCYGRNSSCAARSRQTSVLRKSKGLQLAIAKEITKGWFSQGDYNKLIHMFKACTQFNAAGAK